MTQAAKVADQVLQATILDLVLYNGQRVLVINADVTSTCPCQPSGLRQRQFCSFGRIPVFQPIAFQLCNVAANSDRQTLRAKPGECLGTFMGLNIEEIRVVSELRVPSFSLRQVPA